MPSTPPNTMRLCFAVSLVYLVAGCGGSGRPNPADRPVPADQVLSFSHLYGQNCAGCHGASGKLGPAPPLNDELFRAIVPMAELENVVTKGRHKSLMPAFAMARGGTLTPAQIQVLVHEIKGLPYRIEFKRDGGLARAEVVADSSGISPTWGSVAEPSDSVPAYHHSSNAVYDIPSESSLQGALVFSRACAICHGSGGQGIVDGSKMRHIINDPVSLKLISDQLLRRYMITGRHDLGMPSYSGSRPGNLHFQPLTDQEINELVALLAAWRQAPTQIDIVKD